VTSRAREVWTGLAEWASETPLLRRGVGSDASKASVNQHRVPTMPVQIDGDETDPRSVYDFIGTPLTTVVDADAISGRMLNIFSTRTKAIEYVDAAESPLPRRRRQAGTYRERTASLSAALTAGPPPGQGFYEMYQHDNLDGCYWRILEWEGLTFNYSTKFACGFLWWGWISADNIVSSIDSYVSADHVFLWDFPALGGSNLWIPSGDFRINSLSAFGWNDRISSQNVLYL